MNRRDLLKAAIGIPLAAKRVLPGRWVRHNIATIGLKPMNPWVLTELIDFGDRPPRDTRRGTSAKLSATSA